MSEEKSGSLYTVFNTQHWAALPTDAGENP